MAELRALAATRLVLVRAARADATEPARLTDHDDPGLSAEGRDQAERLRDRLAAGELGRDVVLLTSGARRAVETARVLAPAIGTEHGPPDCGFCEPHTGESDGATVADWSQTHGAQRLAHWSPYAPKSPGGESYAVGIERAARALVEAAVAHEGGTIMIITHTIPLRAAFWVFFGLPFHASYLDLELAPTGLTEWVAEGWLPASGQPRARLARFNDHSHLIIRPAPST